MSCVGGVRARGTTPAGPCVDSRHFFGAVLAPPRSGGGVADGQAWAGDRQEGRCVPVLVSLPFDTLHAHSMCVWWGSISVDDFLPASIFVWCPSLRPAPHMTRASAAKVGYGCRLVPPAQTFGAAVHAGHALSCFLPGPALPPPRGAVGGGAGGMTLRPIQLALSPAARQRRLPPPRRPPRAAGRPAGPRDRPAGGGPRGRGGVPAGHRGGWGRPGPGFPSVPGRIRPMIGL